jgi:hypothetical protein
MKSPLSIDDFTLWEKKVEALKSRVNPDFLRKQMAAGNVRPPKKEPIVRRKVALWTFRGHPVEVSFDPDSNGETEAVERINVFLNGLESRVGELKGAFADWLLDAYNNEWAQGRRRLTREEFVGALGPLKNIEYSKSRTTLYWDDNGLFDGHAVEVRMKNDKASEVLLCG